LATQITAWIGILLYNMPTYRLLLLAPVEVKKPKAKVPPAETKVSLSERGWVGLRVSLEVERENGERRMVRQTNQDYTLTIVKE